MSGITDLDTFGDLLADLYDGPYEPNPFRHFLKKLRSILHLNIACIILRQPEATDGGLLFVSSERVDTTAIDFHDNPYTDIYYAVDPLVDLPLRQVVTLDDVVTTADLENSEFYRLCLESENVAFMAGLDLQDANGTRFTVRLCREKQAGQFTQEERTFIQQLGGHIERSVGFGMRLVNMDAERQLHTSDMSGKSIGSITLDAGCSIIRTNGVAEKILSENDGLQKLEGRLCADHPRINETIYTHMKQILEAQRREEMVPVSAVSVPRPSGRAEYELVIKAIPVDRYVETRNSPHLLVMIKDPANIPTVSINALMGLYHLTQSEARITVLLAQGMSLDAASKELGIARNTVRAHLRAVYVKTGVTQQSMLVSLALKSLAAQA